MARSVLLTSGTLSPLDSFSGELGLDFHVKLEAPHVVNVAKQVCPPPTHTQKETHEGMSCNVCLRRALRRA